MEFKIRYEEQQGRLNDLTERKDELIERNAKIQTELDELKNETKINEGVLSNKERAIAEQKQQMTQLAVELRTAKETNDLLKKELNDRLKPLEEINRTFFDKSGNKGKGELGEERIEVILSKSGVENEF